MDWILSILSTVGIFVAALFILVLFHELGHFLTAKLFKMRVDRFSIGYPPKIAGIQYGETEYCISATPLGGYVKIAGMIDESMDTDYLEKEPQPWEFRSKPVWQRIVVITAGVIFNMILAAVIFAAINFTYGEQVIPAENVGSIYVQEGSVADEVGFEPGDQLVAVNGQDVQYFRDFFSPSRLTSNNLTYTVLRDGRRVQLTMPENFIDKISETGYVSEFLFSAMPSKISGVQKKSPASEAGLQAGDKIVAVNGKDIEYWVQLTHMIDKTEGELQLTVNRGGEFRSFTLTPDPESGLIGVRVMSPADHFKTVSLQHGFFASIKQGVNETGETTVSIVQGLGKLLTGSISVRQNLGGPVAIASVTKDVTDQSGMRGFWQITAFLSVTLAIMNILPIPMLDGGHLMFLIYEGVTRREPSAKVRMMLQQIGFILLVGLIIFVTFNDILREFGY